ncbi:MAG: hypothetical protein ACI9EF_002193, partial [Pseudohongiellaceae bacterium]
MSRENPLWGAPRIAEELALLGHSVSATTVDKYKVRHPSPKRGQSWSTFLANRGEAFQSPPQPARARTPPHPSAR